jgi:hypothetical protein
MSKDGLCARCNYAYATTIDDNMPVCDECKNKFATEEIRKCPVDQEDMNKIIVQNVLIDKCPKCHGIWLDGDEVGVLNNLATGEFKSKWSDDNCKNGGSFWKGLIVGAIISD